LKRITLAFILSPPSIIILTCFLFPLPYQLSRFSSTADVNLAFRPVGFRYTHSLLDRLSEGAEDQRHSDSVL
jgi:hypothetical protein